MAILEAGASAGQPRSGATLDLHEGIATSPRTGCPRWPESLRLKSSRGEFVRGRCRGSKVCAYCGRLAAVENAEMVALDATSDAPTLFCVLTTRDPNMDGAAVRAALQAATRSVRGRWPGFQYACFVEFTTGLSVWSGGRRRVHLNLLVKGVPPADADELRDRLLASWGKATGTDQLHVGSIYAAEGLVRYVTNLALHVMKDGQKPPPSYRGHLVRWTRGYFADGATEAREQARYSLRVKRVVHRLGPEVGPELVALELDQIAATGWSLVEVRRLAGSPVIEPVGEVESRGRQARDCAVRGNPRQGDWDQRQPLNDGVETEEEKRGPPGHLRVGPAVATFRAGVGP